jgi:hypothetical protein
MRGDFSGFRERVPARSDREGGLREGKFHAFFSMFIDKIGLDDQD